MATAELPITKDYLPKWGVWEGLREIVQNGLDEHIQKGSPMEMTFDEGVLGIRNVGSTLDPKAFLFGHTTKANDDRTAGQYGEGLKLGVLALVRADKQVNITVGKDLWKARFIRSKKYGATILGFDIVRNVFEEERDVTVSVSPLSDEEYSMLKGRIISIMSDPPVMIQNNSSFFGSVIVDKAFRGRIFVRGIWVCDKEDMEFGYDFSNVTLNRDRDFVAGWDISYHAAHILDRIISADDADEDLLERVYKVMEAGESDEAKGFGSYLSLDSEKKLAAIFRKQHGEKAVPVSDNNGVRQAEFCGSVGVVVPKAMADALGAVPGLGVKDHVQETEVETLYGLSELTVEEREKLETACLLVSEARGESGKPYFEITGKDLNVVDFNKESTLGLFQYGKISIARKVLERPLEDVLEVVVHEVLHFIGDDGTRSHSEAQAELLCKIVVALWQKPLSH